MGRSSACLFMVLAIAVLCCALGVFLEPGLAASKPFTAVFEWGCNGVSGKQLTPRAMEGFDDFVVIVGGSSHSLALKADGTVWAWGRNNYGQLGDGTTVDRPTPVRVSGLAGVVAIEGGGGHSLALKADGTVWAWGCNGSGQLGDGTTTNRSAPVQVGGLEAVAAVAGGNSHSLALKSDGTVWAWGDNEWGQLGDDTLTDRHLPVLVGWEYPFEDVIAIAGGGSHSLAVKSDGTVWAWGANSFGQVGVGSERMKVWLPEQVKGINDVITVAAGSVHSLALKSDGTVWAWGWNHYGQLGDGSWQNSRYTPVQAVGLTEVIAVAAGDSHSLAFRSDATVLAWGYNECGQLGDGTTTVRHVPGEVKGLYGIKALTCLGSGSSALRFAPPYLLTVGKDGSGSGSVTSSPPAISCGAECSSLIEADTTVTLTATPSGGSFFVGWSEASCPGTGTCTVLMDRDRTITATFISKTWVWSWGWNQLGQLGDGTTTDRYLPVRVEGPPGVIAIAGGDAHSLALDLDGTVWAWGDNYYGQLGDGTTTDRPVPGPVSGLTDVIAIAGGGYQSLALKSDGTVWTSANVAVGQLGDGTITDRPMHGQVGGLTDVVAIAAGSGHSLAVKSDGTVWAWGGNNSGQLGDGTTTGRVLPVQVKGLTDVIAVAGGQYYSLALKSDGTVWAWGENFHGELGDGSTADKHTPVHASGVSDVIAIAAGSSHSVALRKDGTVWAWGDNTEGQLGDGTVQLRKTRPVQAKGLTGVIAVAAASFQSLAVKSDGTAWVWGDNWYNLSDETHIQEYTKPNRVDEIDRVVSIACGRGHSFVLKPDTEAPSYTLKITQLGSGQGIITSSPEGVSSDAGCRGEFTPGTEVTLTAVTDEGNAFVRWSGEGCSGAGTCTVTMNRDRSLIAIFDDIPPCTYTFQPASRVAAAKASSLSVGVTGRGQNVCSPPGVTEDDDWITIAAPVDWKANRGTVKLSIAENPHSASRPGTIMIGGNPFTVTQKGGTCTTKGLAPNGQSFAKGGGTGSFFVDVSLQDCAWTATSSAGWLHVTSGNSTGDGTVAYAVDENPGPSARTGKINVILGSSSKKAAFTVKQAGK